MTQARHKRSSEFFTMLASPRRLQIMRLLLQHGAREVGDLAAMLDITSSAVSQHLKALRDAKLVKYEKSGTNAQYHIYDVDMTTLAAPEVNILNMIRSNML
jgi:DNA-binding transcriptional ArsR family regulator